MAPKMEVPSCKRVEGDDGIARKGKFCYEPQLKVLEDDTYVYCAKDGDPPPFSCVEGHASYVACSWQRAGMFFGWAFFLISLGGRAPHVRCTPMGRTRGEPSEIGRIDRHWGGIERLQVRAVHGAPSRLPRHAQGDGPRPLRRAKGQGKKKPKAIGTVPFIISSTAHLHVRPVGVHRMCGCRWAYEIKLTSVDVCM